MASLFVVNGYAHALPMKEFATNFIQTTNVTVIQSNLPLMNQTIDMEVYESLDDNEDEDCKSKKEIKTRDDVNFVSTTLHFLFDSNHYNNGNDSVIIPKIRHLSLFYKSWQSFLQVFRL